MTETVKNTDFLVSDIHYFFFWCVITVCRVGNCEQKLGCFVYDSRIRIQRASKNTMGRNFHINMVYNQDCSRMDTDSMPLFNLHPIATALK